MRLVRQTTLYFKEGKVDKVYEVDLCEADEGEYVVNFRYGRRGTRLRDGSKTPFPESLEKAESIFDKLVTSKKAKGYSEQLAVEEAEQEPAAETERASRSASLQAVGTVEQQATVKRYLTKPRSSWPLDRVIWRAGELGLADSASTIQSISRKDHLDDYMVAWTLGKLGSGESVLTLRQLRESDTPAVRRMAGEALLQCLSGGEKRSFEDGLEQALPDTLRSLLGSDAAEILDWLNTHRELVQAPNNALYDLYALAERYPAGREAVYEFLKELPLQAPWFRAVRHIFKAAEFRLDAEIYGLIARRFERIASSFRTSSGGLVRLPGKRAVPVAEVLGVPDAKFAYSHKTRSYLRQRVLRNLKRYGEANDGRSFLTMATGVLMAYDDAQDLVEPSALVSSEYDRATRSFRRVDTHFDRYAPYLPLNFLLYQNSHRYERADRAPRWSCRGDYRPSDVLPGTHLPEGREEAFPELWNQAPDAIAHLLESSACGAVHEFAAKVWRGNAAFDESATADMVVQCLARPYPVTQQLGLRLAKQRYDSASPDRDLLIGLLRCDLSEARELAIAWLKKGRHVFMKEAQVLAQILLIPHEDVHAALRDILTLTRPREQGTIDALIGQVVAQLLALPSSDNEAENSARLARQSLVLIAKSRFASVSHEVIHDLLQHPIADVQWLGAQIVSEHADSVETIPDAIWEGLLHSETEPVRQLGMELFGKLPESTLLGKADILASFCLSERSDLRESARPIVERLAKHSPSFAQDMVARFYPIVLRKERYEGLHDDVYKLLEGPLGEHLHVIPADSCFRMMESRYAAGQQLGFLILKKYVGLDGQPMALIAKLGGQDLLAGREHVWDFYRQNRKRVKEEKVDALRIVDANWQDARDFAFDFFENEFVEEDWNPELLVSICDSVRGDVADFGRRLITRFFQKEDGPEYLLKLSQHPTVEMQSFASNYLERFASDDLDKLLELEPYFVTVLSQVNRGRVAKARTLRFLTREAEKSEQAAALVARVLTRQSVTIAIHDKAACISTLHMIGQRWPAIETPLRSCEVPVYNMEVSA